MNRTLRVQLINKYSKVFLAEICFSGVDYLNQVHSGTFTDNANQAMSLCRRKYFLGLGNISIPLPFKYDEEHKIDVTMQT